MAVLLIFVLLQVGSVHGMIGTPVPPASRKIPTDRRMPVLGTPYRQAHYWYNANRYTRRLPRLHSRSTAISAHWAHIRRQNRLFQFR